MTDLLDPLDRSQAWHGDQPTYLAHYLARRTRGGDSNFDSDVTALIRAYSRAIPTLEARFRPTSDEWDVAKPNVAFFDKLATVSRHERHEIAHVGDRLDNDIAPAAQVGLVTVWVRRGPWGHILRPKELMAAGSLPLDAPSLQTP